MIAHWSEVGVWHNAMSKIKAQTYNMPWECSRDLNILVDNVLSKLVAIHKEDIVCRRKGKETPKQRQLVAELDELKDILDQYLILARLIS